MKYSRILVALMLLIGVSQTSRAEEPVQSETRTYGAWIKDSRIGSIQMTVTPITIEGKPAIRVTAKGLMRYKLDAGVGERRMEWTTVSYEDGTSISSDRREWNNGNLRVRRIRYGPKSVTRDEEFLGRKTKIEVGSKGPIVGEVSIFARHLVRTRQFAVGKKFEFRDVSFERKLAHKETLHVDERIVTESGEVRWRVHTTSELDDEDDHMAIVLDDAGLLVAMNMGPLSLRRIDGSEMEFDTSGQVPFGSTISTTPQLQAEHVERVRSMTLRVHLPGTNSAFRSDRYQKVLGQDDRTFQIRLTANPPPAETELAVAIDPDARALFLRETESAEVSAKSIVDASKEAAGDATRADQVAKQIAGWVYAKLGKLSNGKALSALETLKAGEGDCSEHTNLYIALARAAKLPSRSMSGLLLSEDGFTLHAWAESWMGRWVPVDPAWNRVGTGPLYLSLGPDVDDDGISRSSSLQLAAAMGDMTIEILELDLAGQVFDARDAKDVWQVPTNPDVIRERFVLRSGLEVHGQEINRDESHITFRTAYGRTRVARKDLDRIEFRDGHGDRFNSGEHGVSFVLPEGWRFTDQKDWPNSQTITMFQNESTAAGLLLSETYAGKISVYLGLLEKSLKPLKGSEGELITTSIPSAEGEVTALRWSFVNAQNRFHYRIVLWQVGNVCYRLITWATKDSLSVTDPEVEQLVKSIRLR